MSSSPAPLSRRDALKILGTSAAFAGLGLGGLPGAETSAIPQPAPGWDLPKLPYALDALELHIDARTMAIHHGKHHQAYVANARKLLEGHPDLLAMGPTALITDLTLVPETIRAGVGNNAGGHLNHGFFWLVIGPDADGAPKGALADAIVRDFGTVPEFRRQFSEAAAKRFGSGWAWLSVKGDKLVVHSTANQDSPLSEGMRPVLGLDVWEHAYYLHYQNRRADYVTAFWNMLNWTQAGANFETATKA